MTWLHSQGLPGGICPDSNKVEAPTALPWGPGHITMVSPSTDEDAGLGGMEEMRGTETGGKHGRGCWGLSELYL